MKIILNIFYTILLTLVTAGISFAEDCQIKYWEVVPTSKKCTKFILPDFEFKPIQKTINSPTARFCSYYEVSSKEGQQELGYCYTGEGDRTGPFFTVANQKYLADLSFQGCVDGKKSEGIIFILNGWKDSLAHLERSWPLNQPTQKLSCK